MRDLRANSDGYAIEGIMAFTFLLCDGAATENDCASPPAIGTLTIEITPVGPEPATLTLLGLGLAGLGARRWRRKPS